MLPLPGADKEGVIAFRDIKDCQDDDEDREEVQESGRDRRRFARTRGGAWLAESEYGSCVVHIFNN